VGNINAAIASLHEQSAYGVAFGEAFDIASAGTAFAAAQNGMTTTFSLKPLT
jgi:hypothetical protein